MTSYPRNRRARAIYRAPWLNNPEDKIEVRQFLVDESRKMSLPVSRILTLPGQTAYCIEAFRAAFPQAAILGLERDVIIFDALKVWWDRCHRRRTTISHTSLEQWMERHTGLVDLAFLDFTSYPQESLLHTTGQFLDRHLSRPGLCGITYSIHPRVTQRVRIPTAEFYARRTGVAAPTPEGVAAVLPEFTERPITVIKAVKTARDMIFIAVASPVEM